MFCTAADGKPERQHTAGESSHVNNGNEMKRERNSLDSL